MLIGINRICYEMEENHLAFYSIDWNNYREHTQPLPAALIMIQKNHYSSYIIELTKIVGGGDNHFLIEKSLNMLSRLYTDLSRECRELRKELQKHKNTIKLIKDARNNIYAHLDQNFFNYKNNLDNLVQGDLNNTIKKIIDYLNDKSNLKEEFRYNNWEKTNITTFYNLVYQNIINNNVSKDLKRIKF